MKSASVNKFYIFISYEDYATSEVEKVCSPYIEKGKFYVQVNDLKLDEQIRKAKKNAEYQLRAKNHVISNLRKIIKQLI